ncbi:MAG: hypothetical protein ACQERJ_10525, partial [Bacillota bacterium]
MGKQWLIVFSLVVIISTITPPVEALQQGVIIYSVELIELSSRAEQSLKIDFQEQTEEDGQQWWLINNEDYLKELARIEEDNYAALQVGGEEELSRLHYNSWLTTINHQQVAIELTEQLIDFEARAADSYFKLYLQPQRINRREERIKTAVKFSYGLNTGERAELKTTTAVEAKRRQPVAVVVQQLTGAQKDRYRYFALYLRGSVVNPIHLTNQDSVVAVGNLKGVNQLFAAEINPQSKQKAALYFAAAAQGLSWDYFYDRYHLNLNLINDEELFYQGIVNYSLLGANEFFLTARVENKVLDVDQTLSCLGFRDGVQWGENVVLEAAHFPVVAGGEVDSLSEIKLNWETGDWQLWGRRERIENNYYSSAAVNYDLNSSWGIIAKWEE